MHEDPLLPTGLGRGGKGKWPCQVLPAAISRLAELGRRALAVALAAVRGEDDAVLDPIAPTLTVRRSTARPG